MRFMTHKRWGFGSFWNALGLSLAGSPWLPLAPFGVPSWLPKAFADLCTKCNFEQTEGVIYIVHAGFDSIHVIAIRDDCHSSVRRFRDSIYNVIQPIPIHRVHTIQPIRFTRFTRFRRSQRFMTAPQSSTLPRRRWHGCGHCMPLLSFVMYDLQFLLSACSIALLMCSGMCGH